ncbi:hypothetical protein BURMUCF2_A2128, partial [Burkholderia multivorans CF2]
MARGADEVVCGLNRIGEGAAGMRAHAARSAGARDDVAHAIASLASPQAAWMRGQRVTDDGGLDARRPPRRRGARVQTGA